MAYRGRPKVARAKPEGGLVEDVVQQFADRYAFTRELVQNAIDAGATRIDVELVDRDDRLSVRFSDDGSGMTIDVIRGPLLTIFSSTKEGVEGKIGKYGVGFKSVLAVDPVEVVVETYREEGAYRVRLLRDHTFEIETLDPRPGSGTSVELSIDGDGDARRQHEEHIVAALSRWCRHVSCPITLTLSDGKKRAVNVEFGLRAPVVVDLEEDGVRVLVGPTAGTERMPGDPDPEGTKDFAGFYGHGLTLLEVSEREPCKPGLRFKVDGPNLGCTISRDDVRRDRAYERAMKLVERASAAALDEAIEKASLAAAKSYAERGADALAPYVSLLRASTSRRREANTKIALLEPLSDAWSIDRRRLFALVDLGSATAAVERTPLTTRVGRSGIAVVRVDERGEVASAIGFGLPPANERFALLEARRSDGTREALELVATILERAGRRVTDVVPFVVSEGRFSQTTVFVDGGSKSRSDAWLFPVEIDAKGSRLLVEASIVERLMRARHPRRAASLVARIALIDSDGTVSDTENDRILAATVEATG